MAHRSQRSSLEDNPLDPNYLPPHYREEYRLAIDALVEHGLQGYYEFLQNAGVVEFLSHPEVEHILNTVQSPRQSSQPDLLYQEPEADGSSDTYWPVHSDLEAPVLDLGWPVHHSFIGPTEVTTLVNPSDPEMPSIKAQARQLIKRAQQVIAVAMDMFTDIDIFSDLLNAAMRNVAVYILLDEQNAHHFTAMVSSCRVNLAMVKTMRVRTVSGTTYFCRTGKSFKGQMMDRFLLVDCRAVLSGNYSFMWMFEKIHRSIAHLFLGELVTTFDEEFRILYAQSEPLVMEDALGLVSGGSSYSSKQFSSTRPSVSRNPRYLHAETPHFLELPGYPTEGHMDTQRSMSAFRRDEPCPGYLDREPLQKYGNRYSSQELNVERSFLDHDRPVISRQMDMDAYKRHSYTEGTSASSRQFVQHHMKHYPEELESFSRHPGEHHYYHPGGGSGSGHAVYDHVRAHGYHQTDPAPDQYEPGLHPEPEPPGSYSHMVDYLSSDSSREMRYGYGEKPAPAEGWYGRSGTKRPSLGQPYACQTSPTQPHPPDQKHLFTKASLEHQPRDPGSKQGLRKWRINSYLSTLEKSGEEGLAEPLGPDAFDESSNPFTEEQHDLQTAVPRFSNRDNAQIPSSKLDFLPRFGKPMLPKASKDLPEDQPSTGKESPVTTQVAPASGLASNTEGDKAVEVVFRKPRDIMQQESFRTRPNISLLRSSRLRSSLIFSSSQVEQHFSMETKPESEVSGAENPTVEKEALKKSSILAEILEKRKYLPREPISRSSLKQSKPDLSLKDIAVPEDSSEGSSKMLAKITENPDEQSSVKHPEISQSSPKVPEKPEEHHSITQPESPPKVSSEKPEEHPSVPTPESVSTEKPEERPSITQPEISETPPTSSTEKFDALPTVAEPDISISGAVEIGPEKPVMSAEPSKVSLIPSESVVRASEVTLESSQSVAMKQDPQSSGEYVNPMAEETKREPEPKPTPCSLQGDTLRSPLPASAHTHALPSDEELMKDATDAEKSEWMKSRGQRPSGVALGELGETLPRGSSTSPDSVGISRDRNETERPVGLLGSEGAGNTVNEDMPSAPEQPNHEGGETSSTAATDATKMAKSKEQEADHSQVPSAASRTSPSRYQASTTNVLYSSNLRDDTKVILEQISANSQSRMELAKQQTAAITDDAKEVDREQTADKAPENRMPGRGFSRFQRSTISSEDRETLLKKMESMRKEKKVYSRFELGS
ncbi:protein FAM83H-like [Arapaima gigas]